MKSENRDAELIFGEALRFSVPAERQAYLDQACGGDLALRQEVESLLSSHSQAGDFLGQTRQLPAPDFSSERTGTMIGRYKLLEKIGEGGFGVVFMAEQVEPVQRKVALKIIKPGMDTRQVIARFEAERQALALMDHPSIAKILDAGATETGRPYFVMELVRGIPITDYCDRKNLPTVGRLKLFVRVCQALQHAHQKGIIHRDLKPSNVLITLHDGEPVPKVIDFGVAKALGQRLTEKTLFTGYTQMIGTPAYMSPEQAEMSGLDIDTRSDIYSLGVLLYELLTGVTPFDRETFAKAALDEIRRMIRETEPPKPSTRLHTMGEELTEVARHRRTEPAMLSRLLCGDLDWIVMKCLEKDRQRRYETADALSADLGRHLKNEPVTAAAPSMLYLASKFTSRHKAALGVVGALMAFFVVGAIISTWQAVRATRAEQSQSRLRQQAEQLRGKAQDQARQLKHQVYAAHMNMAFQAWERGDAAQVERLLEEQRPQAGEEDLRGFEWFHLWRLCHSAQVTIHSAYSPMRAVTFSPDGRVVATAGADSTARIWDAQTGSELFLLDGHHGRSVTAVAFSPDGKLLATGGVDSLVKIWDAATGVQLASLSGHKHGVTALVFDPDGKWLASASGQLATGTNAPNPSEKFVDPVALAAEVKLWEVATWKPLRTLAGHNRSIVSLAVSADGARLASGSVDGTVKVWNPKAGRLETNLTELKVPVLAVAFSPDGRALAIGGGDPYRVQAELGVWDLATGTKRLALKGHDGPVFAVAFAPDGKTLASAGLDQIVRFWDVNSGVEVRSIKGHRAAIWCVAYDRAGKRVATASWDQTVRIWDAEARQGVDLFAGAGGYSGCFSRDSKWLVRGGRRLQVYELGTGKPPFVVPDYETGDLIVALAPDGCILASAGMDQTVTLWEVGTWRRLASLKGHDLKIWTLFFAPDGRTLASADGLTVRLWDVARRVERRVLRPPPGGLAPTCFTPDGQKLMLSDASGKIVFVDTATGLSEPKTEGRPRAISQDGRYLAVERGGLGIFDLETMQLKWLTHAHREDAGWEVAFSPDGRTLASAGWDGTAKLWNVATGQEIFTYRASGVVWSVCFSPDGNWWAVGSGSARSNEVALFKGATGAESAVRAEGAAPRILRQPASEAVIEGSDVVLAVAVEGTSPLSYQWRNGAADLSGQTNSILSLPRTTAAQSGAYHVVVKNAFGSVMSRSAAVSVCQVREQTIAEVNFDDKQPIEGCLGYIYGTTIQPTKGLTQAGSSEIPAFVVTADSSSLTNVSDRDANGFAAVVACAANRENGINTTNLNFYKLYATIKTSGLVGTNSTGRVQWQFATPDGTILSVSRLSTFTTNYQVYSFVLADGALDPNSGGSWIEFVAKFEQITRVQCAVIVDGWVNNYGADGDNALYVGHVKFVRLVPVSQPASRN